MIALRLIRTSVLAAAGAGVTLAQLNLPSKRFWEGQVPLQWTCVLLLACLGFFEAVRSVNSVVRAAAIRTYDNEVRATLSAAVAEVVSATGIPWDELELRYYRRRGPLFRRRLALVAAVRAGADIADVRQWIRPGVDIVGVAFATGEIIAERWRTFVGTATAQGPVAWKQRSESNRFGLNWGQLRRSPQPEGMVASPTFDLDGRPDGCILLSGPLKLPDLRGVEMRRTLDDVATVLDRLGRPPRGWWSVHES